MGSEDCSNMFQMTKSAFFVAAATLVSKALAGLYVVNPSGLKEKYINNG